MCGIAGYSSVSEAKDLGAAIASMNHRGPDGEGMFTDEDAHVGLAHVRLAILDLLDTGAQPMQNSDTGMVLSYNGEIYNFLELRAELVEAGHIFRGTSDTEVLLTLLERDGLDVLPRLNGMFAFAVYNRGTGETTVVRDAYGVKPQYFAVDAAGVYFASEIRALISMGVSVRPPEAQTVGKYLSCLWNPGTETLASNITSLAPGHAITLKDGKIIRQWQWFRSPTLSPKPVERKLEMAIEETTQHLRAAVHRQMIADVPVGAFLSGGLDSSAVVAFAREKNPDIRCFTIESVGGVEAGTADDLPYAKRVADHLDVPLECVPVNPAEMMNDLELMVRQLEEPLADPACLNVLYITRLARKQGIKVLLSGTGGDDLFTGYRRHHAIALDEKLKFIPTPARRLMENLSCRLDQSKPFNRRAAKFFEGFGLKGDARLINYFLWTRRTDVLALLSSRAKSTLNNPNFTAPMQDYLADMATGSRDLERMLALEQRFFLAEHNLIYTDKMSMACSTEVRVPFLDLDLVDFARTLPDTIKQKGREGKWIFKKSMEPFLPHDVIYRPKTGFGAPLRLWLQGDLKEMMMDLLSPQSLSNRDMFDVKAVEQMISDDAAGRKDSSYTLLSLMCFELWCRNFLDRRDGSAVNARLSA